MCSNWSNTWNGLGGSQIGVVLKVENRQGFENLPRLLLAAMHSPPVGVMVARGDLAVEVGFERLAEVQEEILWLCEAAHVPVIWATQVLEGLAKTGSPTRAEVSDAVMSGRAECVMLNKGYRGGGALPQRRAGAHACPSTQAAIDAAQAVGLRARVITLVDESCSRCSSNPIRYFHRIRKEKDP